MINWFHKYILNWNIFLPTWAVVVAQLVERSLPMPEVCGSNPVTGKYLYWTFTVNCIEKTKIKKKRPGMAHLKNLPTHYIESNWDVGKMNERFLLWCFTCVNISLNVHWKGEPIPCILVAFEFQHLFKYKICIEWVWKITAFLALKHASTITFYYSLFGVCQSK